MAREYGAPDADDTAYKLLLSVIGDKPVRHVMHHQRKPPDARMCQLPGSLLVQAVMLDGSIISVRQLHKGGEAKVLK